MWEIFIGNFFLEWFQEVTHINNPSVLPKFELSR